MRRASRAVAACVALLCAAGGFRASLASFTDQTSNASGPFTAATLTLQSPSDGQQLLDGRLMKPGDQRAAEVTLRHSGDIAADWRVRLAAKPADPLSAALLLRIEELNPPSTIYDGALPDLPDKPIGRSPPGSSRQLRVTVTWPSSVSAAGLSGKSAELKLEFLAAQPGGGAG